MPAIITHYKIFKESLLYLNKKKDYNTYSRSLEILFRNDDFQKAALFGCLGPDIFDFIPLNSKRGFYGSEANKYLHSSGLQESIKRLYENAFLVQDHNNEHSAMKRAYFFGYISHLIADAVFHPFVFYYTGFPEAQEREKLYYFREQFLTFEYNMDLYFEYLYDEDRMDFSIDYMLPLIKRKRSKSILHPFLRDYIIDSFAKTVPSFNRVIGRKAKQERTNGGKEKPNFLDYIPLLIKHSYRYKRNTNERLNRYLEKIRRKKIIFPDFVTLYPKPRQINTHTLNLHRERWFYPTGSSSMHYESVKDLLKIAQIKIVDAWENIESVLYGKKADSSFLNSLIVDAITGEAGTIPDDMKIMNPVRLRI